MSFLFASHPSRKTESSCFPALAFAVNTPLLQTATEFTFVPFNVVHGVPFRCVFLAPTTIHVPCILRRRLEQTKLIIGHRRATLTLELTLVIRQRLLGGKRFCARDKFSSESVNGCNMEQRHTETLQIQPCGNAQRQTHHSRRAAPQERGDISPEYDSTRTTNEDKLHASHPNKKTATLHHPELAQSHTHNDGFVTSMLFRETLIYRRLLGNMGQGGHTPNAHSQQIRHGDLHTSVVVFGFKAASKIVLRQPKTSGTQAP